MSGKSAKGPEMPAFPTWSLDLPPLYSLGKQTGGKPAGLQGHTQQVGFPGWLMGDSVAAQHDLIKQDHRSMAGRGGVAWLQKGAVHKEQVEGQAGVQWGQPSGWTDRWTVDWPSRNHCMYE